MHVCRVFYTPYTFTACVLFSRLVGFHVVAFVIVRRGLFDAKSKVVVPCEQRGMRVCTVRVVGKYILLASGDCLT